ncbi:MAG: hypothetical protein LBD52_02620 [Prevotellaceae bacterium]|jgi:flavodoxin|nr:hypothetical protein [Prevotellaceae bacterium]
MTATIRLNAQNHQDKKILVAYFSWSGNTRVIAEQIQKLTSADIFEIKATKPYPTGWNDAVTRAQKEERGNERPAIVSKVNNMDIYDTVFIGYPIWDYNIPMIIATFLESYNIAGKTIVPFCTHAGAPGEHLTTLKQITARAIVLEVFEVRGSNARDAQPQVEAWLRRISYLR